jgi:hypothetical protein
MNAHLALFESLESRRLMSATCTMDWPVAVLERGTFAASPTTEMRVALQPHQDEVVGLTINGYTRVA